MKQNIVKIIRLELVNTFFYKDTFFYIDNSTNDRSHLGFSSVYLPGRVIIQVIMQLGSIGQLVEKPH